MIKVCHMTSAHNSQDVRILKKQCTSLAKKYETYLVAKGESYVENNVNVVGIGEVVGGRLKRMTQTTKLIYKKSLELDCDIYQIHDPELLPYAKKLKKRGKKVIFDSHESVIDSIYEKEYINIHFRKTIAKLCESYFEHIFKRIDYVITVTPHIVEIYKNMTDSVAMITNYPILKLSNITTKDRTIVFAGGISKQWNHEIIIDAIQNIDITYKLCGIGSAEYIESLIKRDRKSKLDYIGKIPHDEIAELLARSNAGVALLDYNLNAGGDLGTLGNTKIFEYMMAGIPIICTDFVLWKEIINEYECGIFVNTRNQEEIENAIKIIIKDIDIAKKMGENGQRAIKEKFNWDIEEKKLFKLYEEVLG